MEQKYIDINYWIEIHKKIDVILNDINGILLLTHNSIKLSQIIKIINLIKSDKETNIAYISLVRSKGYIDSILNYEPLHNKKISIIDCVSGYAFADKEGEKSLYHKPPSNLIELKEILSFSIEQHNPDIVILDSLSQFINFSKINDTEINLLYSFLETIKYNLSKNNQITFILLYDDKLNLLKNLPKGFVDFIIKIDVVEEEINESLKIPYLKI
jgi:hypothetical protein